MPFASFISKELYGRQSDFIHLMKPRFRRTSSMYDASFCLQRQFLHPVTTRIAQSAEITFSQH